MPTRKLQSLTPDIRPKIQMGTGIRRQESQRMGISRSRSDLGCPRRGYEEMTSDQISVHGGLWVRSGGDKCECNVNTPRAAASSDKNIPCARVVIERKK
ncbi:hypothetical protein ElyMa_003075000 [Elysia marginata]|uniref:Uncharacterized protein n=1 Tax=Elysia marginata TaxID=1093978 RepID=A0AAV4ILC1_9GAST|nr:hypothetical protein ElyMa_003075000 [Elysia marginata]